MTKIVIVGEAYYSDLAVGGGPVYPGVGQPSHPWVPPSAGAPSHPIHIPGVGPVHPIVIPGVPEGQPGSPSHPIYIPGAPSHPIAGAPGTPSHPWVPPSGEPLPPPPSDIADNTVVAVWKPEAQAWTVTVYEPIPHA